MDRKDEIIRLQNKLLHQYAQHELKMIGQDLWGAPADPKVKALHEKVAEITKEEAPVQQTAKEETKDAQEAPKKPSSIVYVDEPDVVPPFLQRIRDKKR